MVKKKKKLYNEDKKDIDEEYEFVRRAAGAPGETSPKVQPSKQVGFGIHVSNKKPKKENPFGTPGGSKGPDHNKLWEKWEEIMYEMRNEGKERKGKAIKVQLHVCCIVIVIITQLFSLGIRETEFIKMRNGNFSPA